NWAMMRLPSLHGGYSLDLDSTRVLHEDGRQEGVTVGYTRLGNKPCLHPLLAVLEEPKLVVGFWLRAGNSSCANNIIAFTLELRHLGWMDRVTAATLRFRLFTTGGIISKSGGRTTIRLAVPPDQRPWWRRLFEKLLSRFPNCNSLLPSPP